MSPMNDRSRPQEGGPEAMVGASFSVRHDCARRLRDDLDGALVVLVYTPNGVVRRRVFLTVAAAQRAADRAEARGDRVRVELCKLVPVSEVLR